MPRIARGRFVGLRALARPMRLREAMTFNLSVCRDAARRSCQLVMSDARDVVVDKRDARWH